MNLSSLLRVPDPSVSRVGLRLCSLSFRCHPVYNNVG